MNSVFCAFLHPTVLLVAFCKCYGFCEFCASLRPKTSQFVLIREIRVNPFFAVNIGISPVFYQWL